MNKSYNRQKDLLQAKLLLTSVFEILLYNPIKDAQKKEESLGSFSIRSVVTHPTLKSIYKLMLLSYKAHFYPLVSLLRRLIVNKV